MRYLMCRYTVSARRACLVVRATRSSVYCRSRKDPLTALRQRMRELAQTRVRFGTPAAGPPPARRMGGRERALLSRVYRGRSGPPAETSVAARDGGAPRAAATGHGPQRHLEHGLRRRPVGRWPALSRADGHRSLHPRMPGDRHRPRSGRPGRRRDARAPAIRARPAAADLLRQRDRVRQCRDGPVGVHQRRHPRLQSPGKPTDNATIESFNGRFREECLNVHWFASLEDALQKIDAFRWDYNEHRPHRSLKGLSPREFARGGSQRPQTHRRSGPINPVPSERRTTLFLFGLINTSRLAARASI